MALTSKLADGAPAVGNWLSLSDPTVAELTAEFGFDFAMIDIEHTPHSLETVTDMVRGVEAGDGDADALVRLPWNDPVTIKRVLDVGVDGLMAPMIEDGEEAADFVDATQYPPEGSRGVAGGRAATYGLEMEEYIDRANDELIRIAQIETPAGVENAPSIAETDGLDALFLGPADLSTNLGEYGNYESDEFEAAVETVLAAGADAGIPVATLAFGADEIESWVQRGFDVVIAGSDVSHFVTTALQSKTTFARTVESRES